MQNETQAMRYLAIPSDLTTPIQDHDFATAAFDNSQPHNNPLQKLYIMVSTPRSGSTALCSEIYRQTGLVVHEYLQPFQYMPYLASRYGAIKRASHNQTTSRGCIIVLSKYLGALVKHRAREGTLGINCHVSHLFYLDALIESAKSENPSLVVYKDYLYRQDKHAQAASYAIAKQTRVWSTTQKKAAISMSRLKRLRLCVSAAGYYKKLKAEEQRGLGSSPEHTYERLLTYESHIQKSITKTASKVALTLCLSKQAPIQPHFRDLKRQASSLNSEIANSIRRHMRIFLILAFIGKPLGKAANRLSISIKLLKHQSETPKLRFWLEVGSQ